MKSSFSIIIPFRNRREMLIRSLNSISNQTYDHNFIEVVVVDDASTDDSEQYVREWAGNNDFRFKYCKHDGWRERVAARNTGMKASTNQWICWLDSDDEYLSRYIEIFNDAISNHQDLRIFNCGAINYIHRNEHEFGYKIRDMFRPGIVGKGHEDFRSGLIGTGSFIFHRSLLDEVELMKETLRPYGDPGCFPELNRNPNYPMREDGQWVPMGNPWGDDYHWFWLITRENHSMPINMPLYVQHQRSS